MGNSMEILKTIPYSEFNLWDVNRYANEVELISAYKLIPLNSLLHQSKTYEKIQDEEEYYLCGLSSYGNGLFHRDIKLGKEIKGNKLNQIKNGQFIYSRLGANNGSFDIVNEKFDKYWVTNEFPTFNIDDALNPEYLKILFRLKRYWKIISRKLQGAAHKRFKENLFLDLKIPFPHLTEQNHFVDNFNAKIQLANEQKKKSNQLEREINDYLFEMLGVTKIENNSIKKGLRIIEYSKLTKWALSHSLKQNKFNIQNSKYNTAPIKDILLFFKGGKTPSKQRKDFWNGKINWTSPKDFNGLYIDKSEDYITEKAVIETKMEIFPTGTLISVFRSGILRHSFPTAILNIPTSINQDLKAYDLKVDVINKKYYLYFTEVFKEYILLNASKKSVTVESINTEEFLDLKIPLPPLNIQKQIANHISDLKKQIKDLQNQEKENRENAIKEFEKGIFN